MERVRLSGSFDAEVRLSELPGGPGVGRRGARHGRLSRSAEEFGTRRVPSRIVSLRDLPAHVRHLPAWIRPTQIRGFPAVVVRPAWRILPQRGFSAGICWPGDHRHSRGLGPGWGLANFAVQLSSLMLSTQLVSFLLLEDVDRLDFRTEGLGFLLGGRSGWCNTTKAANWRPSFSVHPLLKHCRGTRYRLLATDFLELFLDELLFQNRRSRWAFFGILAEHLGDQLLQWSAVLPWNRLMATLADCLHELPHILAVECGA